MGGVSPMRLLARDCGCRYARNYLARFNEVLLEASWMWGGDGPPVGQRQTGVTTPRCDMRPQWGMPPAAGCGRSRGGPRGLVRPRRTGSAHSSRPRGERPPPLPKCSEDALNNGGEFPPPLSYNRWSRGGRGRDARPPTRPIIPHCGRSPRVPGARVARDALPQGSPVERVGLPRSSRAPS